MRENRPSGSEGGAAQLNALSLPLYLGLPRWGAKCPLAHGCGFAVSNALSSLTAAACCGSFARFFSSRGSAS